MRGRDFGVSGRVFRIVRKCNDVARSTDAELREAGGEGFEGGIAAPIEFLRPQHFGIRNLAVWNLDLMDAGDASRKEVDERAIVPRHFLEEVRNAIVFFGAFEPRPPDAIFEE